MFLKDAHRWFCSEQFVLERYILIHTLELFSWYAMLVLAFV